MSRRWIISGLAAVAAVMMTANGAAGCGGGYGYYIETGTDRQMLMSPDGYFLAELQRVLPAVTAPFEAKQNDWYEPATKLTVEAGITDLQTALRETGMADAQAEPIVQAYRKLRQQVTDQPSATHVEPAGLPLEFAWYLKGARAWRTGDVETARWYWLRVLMLPADQRKYRSVWAAYMLGRSCVGENDALVIDGMQLTRALAAEGFADSTGLAAASYGWQAMAVYKRDRLAGIELYVRQLATGDRTAAASLRMCAAEMMAAGDDVLGWAVRHELTRGLITAHLAAGYSVLWLASADTGAANVKRWLGVMERADVRDVAGAGRLAWAAYRTNQMDLAQRWADRAAADDVIACWIRAKLLLRAGKLDAAAGQLAIALHPPGGPATYGETDEKWQTNIHNNQIADDLAALRLNHRQYTDAMNLLARYDHLYSAMYVAERVLDADELKAYIDVHADSPLSELLARRLVREGRWKQGRRYFTAEHAAMLDQYVAAIRRGHDEQLDRAARADAFWAAAVMLKQHGEELIGYATEPWYPVQPDGRFRNWVSSPRTWHPEGYTIAPPSADELARAERHQPPQATAWHWLYEAAGHAWRACQLMPDEDARTAERLCEAGTWLKYGDPQAADKFYKALVNRCGATALGREADKLHWFPKLATQSPP